MHLHNFISRQQNKTNRTKIKTTKIFFSIWYKVFIRYYISFALCACQCWHLYFYWSCLQSVISFDSNYIQKDWKSNPLLAFLLHFHFFYCFIDSRWISKKSMQRNVKQKQNEEKIARNALEEDKLKPIIIVIYACWKGKKFQFSLFVVYDLVSFIHPFELAS